jgi:4-amino-4-deoxy-L-arabinose transferase-like glycosyltransferase
MKRVLRSNWYTLIFVYTLIYFSTRLPGLYIDAVNTDGINWHERTYHFVRSLRVMDLAGTYQEYHPGVVLMGLSSVPITAYSKYLALNGKTFVYSPENFLDYDYVVKITVVVAGYFLSLLAFFLLSKIIKKKVLVVFAIFSLLEPFYLGQNRLYHLDFLMTQFIFLSFLSLFIYIYKETHVKYFVLSALLLALGILTKQTALVFLPFLMLGFFIRPSSILDKLKIDLPKSLALVGLTALFIFLMFPALWVNPVRTLSAIWEGTTEVGIEGAFDTGYTRKHKQMIDGVLTYETPKTFYLQVLAYVLSPVFSVLAVVLIPLGVYVIFRKDGKVEGENKVFILSLLSAGYLLLILTIAGKQIDRYIVATFPFLFLSLSLALFILSKRAASVILLLYVLSLVPQYVRIHPYYYNYANPLLGGLQGKHDTVGVKPFGIAAYSAYQSLKNDMNSNYKEKYMILAPKSVDVLSENSFVVRAKGCAQCDYLVFYIDDLPTADLNGFRLIDTIYVDNLPYWFIYKHK